MSDRDPRRLFTDAQKLQLLIAANYQCQGTDCSERDLRNGQAYEFHHEHRHADGGLTSLYNGRVLCVPCHKKLVGKSSSRDISSLDSIWSTLREWQQQAFDRFVDLDDRRVFALEAAPGAGKTLFAAVATRYEIDSHSDISHVICIAPWRPILTSMRKAFGRLQMELRDGFHYDRKAGILQRPPLGDVTLDTYAGFCNRDTVDVLKEWKVRHNFKFMLILDEVHHTNIFDGKWGPFAVEIANLASKVLVMSGTYFRSDNKAISFLKYENNVPSVDYSISYSECVRHRYVRQVGFRFCDPPIEIFRRKQADCKTYNLSKIPKASIKMLQVAKKEVLDPCGKHVAFMICEAWEQLQKMRSKWDDAACLVVCQPGFGNAGNETKMVQQVARKITDITSQIPCVVTCDDKTSHSKIEAFCESKDPFLCAIRMVSEGVDVPRIRVVLFLSYTDSEMLFRQIVGRGIRYIDGKEDDTAALVVMPRFPVMGEFADRFESEAKLGAVRMESIPERSGGDGESSGQSVCNKCGLAPCECYVVIGSDDGCGGGQIAGSDVREDFISRAKIITESSSAHQHANLVQLADALQRSDAISHVPVRVSLGDQKELMLRNVCSLIEKIAERAYSGEVAASYKAELHHKYNVKSVEEIRQTWRLEQIGDLTTRLRSRLREVLTNG